MKNWAVSSAGEHHVDIVGVTGSIPVRSTILFSNSDKDEKIKDILFVFKFFIILIVIFQIFIILDLVSVT